AVLFFPVIMDCGIFFAAALWFSDVLTVPMGRRDTHLFFMASANGIFYFALIVGYSTFIPCTWRRWAIMVGIIALTPLTISLAACLTHEPVARNLLWFFLAMVIWMTIAVAIAVYGTHRVEALRREVSEARKLGQYVLKHRLGAGGMGE